MENTKKDILWVHLPDGNKFRMVTTTDNWTQDNIDEVRELFGDADRINFQVYSGDEDKKMTLILWGDILRNSYITIE